MRCPWTLLLLSLLLCGATLYYTIKNLEINTNTAEMLSPDLPFQQNQAHFNQAFPEDATTIFCGSGRHTRRIVSGCRQACRTVKQSKRPL